MQYFRSMDYPLYRKYPGNTAFFEVLSAEEFREVKIIGNHFEVHHIKAKILPERTYISDLINNEEGHYVESSADEFAQILQQCREQRKPLG